MTGQRLAIQDYTIHTDATSHVELRNGNLVVTLSAARAGNWNCNITGTSRAGNSSPNATGQNASPGSQPGGSPPGRTRRPMSAATRRKLSIAAKQRAAARAGGTAGSRKQSGKAMTATG